MTELKDKLKELPTKPGVYLMKDAAGKIIYIGKAKSLRSRVRSYFTDSRAVEPKVETLRSKIADLEILVTDNEIEALILEANLVKQHKPRYNVNLKDDKHYPYLKITNDDGYPRLIVTRRVRDDGALYFGPYAAATAMWRTQRMLVRQFRLRTCNYQIPHPRGRKYKVCLQYHIKHCPGPCEDLISPEQYGKEVQRVVRFLQGKSEGLIEELQQEMLTYSEQQEYEEAARVRDQITSIASVVEKQKVDAVQKIDQDVIASARSGGDLAVVVLQIREGLLIGRQNHYLQVDMSDDNSSIAAAFLKQYYLDAQFIPAEVFCSLETEEAPLIREWLSRRRGGAVNLHFPQRGDKLRLVEMAQTNARLLLGELLTQKQEKREKLPYAVERLQKDIYLQRPPTTIAAFDISNLGATDPVGSLVFFRMGKPAKKNYRHFRIKTVVGQDDFAMMREVVSRYFSRVLADEEEMPDLCLIDGGRGQLNAALEALEELGINDLQICGLAKKLEEIVLPDEKKSLTLPRHSAALKLLQRVRDEAHRFAITHHKKLRDRKTTKSVLDDVPGIGPRRKEKLLREFGSVEKIAAASEAEIANVVGGQELAARLLEHLQKQ
ncbi:MAG: excinuclease ABC subunit UvrC [bacterium]